MLRTIEISMVILILAVAFIAATFFAVLPSPKQISSPNLRQLALTTLQVLDVDKSLTEAIFENPTDPAWTDLEIALSASLPPNIVYNLTVYDITKSSGDALTYRKFHSITNSESGLGTDSEASTYLVMSTNVTFAVTPQKISGTLYILNCSDANGWWITGYTSQSLAEDLYNLLSPYFNTTIMVQNTTDLGHILDGTEISSLPYENVTNAVIINTCGEAVPIPSAYADSYPRDSYAEYCYELGKRVNQYNWTWVSIVGYPFFYVSNTIKLASSDNSWGIYGMRMVTAGGLNSFLRGLDVENYPSYSYDGSWITGSPGVVYFSTEAYYYSNYYGIYPSPYQTATRALPSWIQGTYHTTVTASVFNPVSDRYAAATFKHTGTGAFTAIGLTRTPDIRITALSLLMYYHPIIYKSEFTLTAGERPTQRLIVLQLSQQGGS
ncbi:MAG: hypothetical protein OEY24_01900 [Candidatus Bathyarchaeota archaeon]|nr:hypothetical protein [Candidatus Bathyarchaeota archaeon]MDH5494443.1 hypothetical protein [Candidatus Bathyarchaeota archaeon]